MLTVKEVNDFIETRKRAIDNAYFTIAKIKNNNNPDYEYINALQKAIEFAKEEIRHAENKRITL